SPEARGPGGRDHRGRSPVGSHRSAKFGSLVLLPRRRKSRGACSQLAGVRGSPYSEPSLCLTSMLAGVTAFPGGATSDVTASTYSTYLRTPCGPLPPYQRPIIVD